MTSPRILIIGSGAVGAVYGHYLAKAGCHVNFLVRNPASSNSAMPRTLHRYGLLGGLTSHQQLLRTKTIADSGWDQVWLCVPSTALSDPWLTKQLARIGPDSPLLLWTPDMRDRDRLAKIHGGSISRALIGLISFQTPLPGENQPPTGIAYLAPPRSAVLEDTDTGRQAAALLKQGGLSVQVHSNLDLHEARMTAMLQPLIAALEICEWSLKKLSDSPWLEVGARAIDEARAIGECYLEAEPSRSMPGKKWLARLALSLAPPLSPFPIETYLHYHFSKVGDQTRAMLDGWIEQAGHQQQPCSALQSLRDALP